VGAWIRLAAVGVGALLARPAVAEAVAVRMTNVDLIADAIATNAAPDDLVVVFPWVCGITFQRYYQGETPWITWPDFEEHVVHSHDRVAEKMKLGEAAIRPELGRVEETLRRGNAVWIAGRLVAPDAGRSPPPLPPAPTGSLRGPVLGHLGAAARRVDRKPRAGRRTRAPARLRCDQRLGESPH
jgi:hypothetical protein